MISIIVSSQDPAMLEALKENISTTIKVPFEVIAIANSGGAISICQAYNKGARESKFDILCFVHEDVRIHTKGWGEILHEALQDQSIGLLGIAGSVSRADFPAPWGAYEPHLRYRLIQHDQHGMPIYGEHNPKQERFGDVAMVDGCWMACRRETWKQHPFDEETFKGFHLYDEDFSFQISRHLRICVTYDILMEHFSPGGYDRDWFEAAEIFHKKWKHRLPILLGEQDRKELALAREYAFQVLRSRLRAVGYSRKELAFIAMRYPKMLRQHLYSNYLRKIGEKNKL